MNVYKGTETDVFEVSMSVTSEPIISFQNVAILSVFECWIVAQTDEVIFSIQPNYESVTFPSTPGYVDGEHFEILKTCGVSTSGYGLPCATINSDIWVVSNSESTWGNVKNIYR